jgi:hypothetical protein
VAGKGTDGDMDNCRMEFQVAAKQKHGVKGMIAVAMEEEVRDQKKWEDPLDFELGNTLYLDSSPSVQGEARRTAMKTLVQMVREKGN